MMEYSPWPNIIAGAALVGMVWVVCAAIRAGWGSKLRNDKEK
jgi:hypothetical protein